MKFFKQISWQLWVFVCFSILTYSWLAYFLERSQFVNLLICFALAFGGYLYVLVNKKNEEQFHFFLFVGIFFRFLFIFSTPQLSDDYFRFLWDGHLLNLGIKPFDFKPSEVQVAFPNKEVLLAGMNSQAYYSIYPPIAQYVYAFATALSPNSILGSIVLLRLPIFFAEIGTILLLPKLLKQLKMPVKRSLIYVLNPLVIVELSGNLHFEGILIFFLLLGIYLMVLNKVKLAALPWSLAVATKLIPLIFLPVFIRKYSYKKALIFYLLIGILFLFWWFPFVNANFIANFFTSFQLYFSTFEFNAGVYYVIRELGWYFLGYNPIQSLGPWMSRITLLAILTVLLYQKEPTWKIVFNQLLFALTIYYVFALIIHPWYITTLVFLAVFSRFTFPILWSALIVLSYAAYQTEAYRENYYLIAIEYVVLFACMVVELLKIEKKNKL